MGSHDKVEGLRKSLTITNTSLLATHTGLFFFFLFLDVRFMYIVNIVSILTYVTGIFLIRNRKLFVYITLALTEVLLHLVFATICMGWEAGFALYTMPIIFIAFYMRYIFDDNRFLGKLPEIASFLSAITFLLLKVHTIFSHPLYDIPLLVINVVYLVNCAIIFGFIILCMYAFTSLVMNRETSLNELADFDELTQLYNRHKMRDVLEDANNQSKAGSTRFATAIMDIDDFKKVNDTYGHDAGDYVLRTISEIMRHSSRESDDMKITIGRWGGEEFLIVLEYPADRMNARTLCTGFMEELLDAIRGYSFIYMGVHFSLTMTAGLAYHDPEEPIAVTINRADRFLYNGKEHGKNMLMAQ